MSFRGGVVWKEGADTCIFKPPVRCEGEQERTPGAVSRIAQKEQASRDVKIETYIRTAFPILVERNLVTVHTRTCVPTYDAEDLSYAKGFQPKNSHGCDKLSDLASPGVYKNHVNMLTPERGETVYNFLLSNPAYKPTWKSMISGILEAAITMVPDKGPWVIHTDAHLGNVLTVPKGQGEAPDLSLSDWGRVLAIQNPQDIESVRQGIREWAKSISYLGIAPNETNDTAIVDAIMKRLGNAPQHPVVYHDMFQMIFAVDPALQLAGVNKLRSWLPCVLIIQTVAVVDPQRIDEWGRKTYSAVVGTRSQQELGDAVFSLLYGNQQGGMYWPKKYYTGLTQSQRAQRKRSVTRRIRMSSKNPKAYAPFKSDKGAKTRKSSYTERFHKKYPGVTSMPAIAKATGISKSILDQVYDRGMAAWRTGHRPGASQQAWGMARVYSFALKGKTWRTADADLARKV